MKKLEYRKTFARLAQSLQRQHGKDRGYQLFVGGEFEVFGILERELLIQNGLQPHDYLIDIGCGSGRLAYALKDYLQDRYLGIDIVPELLDYARGLMAGKKWRFEVAKGLTIPESDSKADMVCFFSVFTHLLHEQSFRYLQEALRVLKPSGKIVFSFLEFSVDSHWNVFESNLKHVDGSEPLNMFLSRDAIQAWCFHLELNIDRIERGDDPFITLENPVVLESGQRLEGSAAFGQSVCVLSRK